MSSLIPNRDDKEKKGGESSKYDFFEIDEEIKKATSKKKKKKKRLFNFGSLPDKEKKKDDYKEEQKQDYTDLSWLDRLEKKQEIEIEFRKDYGGLIKSIKHFLKEKYGSEEYYKLLRRYEKSQFPNKIVSEISNIINKKLEKKLDLIEKRLISLENEKRIDFLERTLQNFLIDFPNVIEPELNYINKEYRLDESNYRGDLLFEDSDLKTLHVELKVVNPGFSRFEEQMTNYLENTNSEDRILYIAPIITDEQREFCNNHSIEFKIIDLKKFLR